MSFSIIGNMNTHLKAMEMKSMWDLKKDRGNFTKGATSLDQLLEQLAEDTQKPPGSEKDEKLSEILQKYYAGGKLTAEEKDYLRDKAPEVYKELMSVEQEQKAYERELRRCKTKEEVERLRMTRLSSSLVTVNAVDNNSNIPLEKKMEIIAKEKRRVDAMAESTRKFVESGEYAKLPTEQEAAEVQKEELEEKYIQPEEEAAEIQDGEETPKQDEPGTGEASESITGDNPESASETAREAGTAGNPESGEPEFDIESQEERKVRYARAKAAYAAMPAENLYENISGTGLSMKA